MLEANTSPSSGCPGKEKEAPEYIEPSWPCVVMGEDIVAELFEGRV